MKKINKRLDSHIPVSQAAHKWHRSIIEYVLKTKLLIEQTISSKNEAVLFSHVRHEQSV